MQITLGQNTVDTFSPAILLGIHMSNLLRNKLKVKVSFIFRLHIQCVQLLCPVHKPSSCEYFLFLWEFNQRTVFPIGMPTKRDVQLMVVVLSPKVISDTINDELESCNQKTSVLSQSWQQAWIPESLSPHPQLRLVCQIKDTSFLHTHWLTWFTNTPPTSRAFPPKHDAPWARLNTQAELQCVGRNGCFNSYWPFAGKFFETGALPCLILAMLKILLVLLKRCACFLSCCFAIIAKFWSMQKMDKRDARKMLRSPLHRALTSRIKTAPVKATSTRFQAEAVHCCLPTYHVAELQGGPQHGGVQA